MKNTIEFISALLYSIFLAGVHRKSRRAVIYYHSLKKEDVTAFEKQMAYLANYCNVVKASEITAAPTNRSNVTVAITFDDALVSFLDNALPILQKYKLPAGIFVPVENLGLPVLWNLPDDCHEKGEQVITKEQVAELDREGFEVFSHTLTHRPLTELQEAELDTELVGSKAALEKVVGHEIIGISYPYGAYDSRVCEAARKAGYKIGFTIERKIVSRTTDDLAIGRFSVSPQENLIKFKLKAMGAYQGVNFLRFLKALAVGKQ